MELFQQPYHTHLILKVDVTGPTVELLLQARHHRIVPRYSVNARGLQAPCFHNTTAGSHDQGDTLGAQTGERALETWLEAGGG